MTFVAALPILLALSLLVALRWPASRAMPVCATVTLASAAMLWGMPAVRITATLIEAVSVTASILLIVFGALFFLDMLRLTGAITVLQRSVAALSQDARIQAILVGWTLGSFIEGSAGFGTPAAITAPLLIGLGFRPLQAVVVALVGDSTAVSFGAIGTPMLIGIGQGLGQSEGAPTVDAVALQIATYDLLLGTLMPAILVMTYVISEEGWSSWRRALPALPFACLVGFAQAVTAWTVVAILGPEFPSLLGPVAGFAIAFLLLRFKWFVPKPTTKMQTSHIRSGIESLAPTPSRDHELPRLPSRMLALTPYLILVVSLIITRTRALPVGEWLSHWKLGSNDLFATGIAAQLQPLYSPGTVFVICAVMCVWIFRATWADLGEAARTAGRVTLKTSIALLAAIVTVRLFLQSGGNQTGLPAMPLVLAETLSIGLGSIWPAVAPIVGALGAFISGSATFSNMLFALLQLEVAIKLDYDPTQILALQGIGAAAGNMTCIHNVVAACAVAGILGQEGNVIRQTAIPMLFYLFVAGMMGLIV